jgi:hypothetical protein
MKYSVDLPPGDLFVHGKDKTPQAFGKKGEAENYTHLGGLLICLCPLIF